MQVNASAGAGECVRVQVSAHEYICECRVSVIAGECKLVHMSACDCE